MVEDSRGGHFGRLGGFQGGIFAADEAFNEGLSNAAVRRSVQAWGYSNELSSAIIHHNVSVIVGAIHEGSLSPRHRVFDVAFAAADESRSTLAESVIVHLGPKAPISASILASNSSSERSL